MKNFYRLTLYLFIFTFAASCAEDDLVQLSDPKEYGHEVGFNDQSELLGIPEGATGAYLLEVATSDIVESEIVVNFEITNGTAIEGEHFEVLESSGSVTILPGARKASIPIQPIDNEVFENPNNQFKIKLTSTSAGSLGYHGNPFAIEKTIQILNNDCPGPISGVYLSSTEEAYAGDGSGGNAAGPFTWTDYEVEFDKGGCEGFITEFSVSDITFGLYPLLYGDPPNPGVLTIDTENNTVNIDPADNPDTVYGGDSFSGTGTFDPINNSATVSWTNGYGDKGVATIIFN